MGTKTMRVDERVRARIAARARAEGTSMSQVIDEALDARDEQEFWSRVRRTMTTPQAREELTQEAENLSGGMKL
jgi:hypothetical protein